MKKFGVTPIIAVLMCCLFVSSFIAGCTSTKNLVGYLKFWGPKNETGQTVQAQKEQTSTPQTRTALKGNPDSHYLLGQYLQQQGKHREAIEEFTKTIKIDKEYAKAYNAVGISYDNLGEFDKATKWYEVALDLSPTGEHYNNLGYNLVLKGEYNEAVEQLETATAIDPGNDRIRNNLALAYSNRGSHDLALGEIQKTSDPNGNRLALAQTLLNTGKARSASDFVTQASRLDPTFEQKLPEKDQFLIRMARSLNQPEETKVAVHKTGKPAMTVKGIQKKDKEAIAAKRDPVGVKTAKARAAGPNTQRVSLYAPDFMFNKASNANGTVSDSTKLTSKEEPNFQALRQLFPLQYASDKDMRDRTPHSPWF